jgi:endonuclease III
VKKTIRGRKRAPAPKRATAVKRATEVKRAAAVKRATVVKRAKRAKTAVAKASAPRRATAGKRAPERRWAESPAALRHRMATILERLEQLYPQAKCSLGHENPLQLLIATILSAQCTDARVNMVTPALFARYPDARAFAEADLGELEEMIRSTGFYHNKARNIIACARELLLRYGGQVPADLESLVALPGIGRKTANVVLGNAFGIPGLVVDTHVTRLANLMFLTAQKDPNKIETDLMEVVPREKWTNLAHLFIEHGRRVCVARRPRCGDCVLHDVCPSSAV